MRSKLTKHDEKALIRFLTHRRASGALDLTEIRGFLLLACCPETIRPSEWLPLGVGEAPEYSSMEEAQAVLESLMIIYNQINGRVFRRQPRLPKECRLLPQTMANFQDGAALHRWSSGFAKASAWLQDVWQDALSEEDYAEYLAIHAVLGAPGQTAYLEAFENAPVTSSEEEHAKLCLRMIPKAMMSLAVLGRGLRESTFQEAQDSSSPHH